MEQDITNDTQIHSNLSVSKYVLESSVFTDEEKDQIIRELLFKGSSSILETYGIELSYYSYFSFRQ